MVIDPNETLKRIRALLNIRRMTREQGEEIQGLIEHLDDWLSKGGFLPTSWMKGRAGVVHSSEPTLLNGTKANCSQDLTTGGVWPRIKN